MIEYRPNKVWQVAKEGEGFFFSALFNTESMLDELETIHNWLRHHDIPLSFKQDCYHILDPEKAALFKLTWC